MNPAWVQNRSPISHHLTPSQLCAKNSWAPLMTHTRAALCKALSSMTISSGKRSLQEQVVAPGSRSTATAASQMDSSETKLGATVASRVPQIVIGNPEELERKKRAIKAAGLSSLQVIADFDMTLTKYMVNGTRGQSTHALLNQGNAEYDLKRQQLFDHYYPLETCPTIPVEQKTKLMEEWWGKTHNLLVEGGLTFKAIQTSVANAVIGFRSGVVELLEILEAKSVPVLIFSAGLADIIEEVMRQKLHRSFKNIRVVSNRMDFDGDGNLLGFKGKLIHVLNKNEHSLEMAAPLHDDHGHEVVNNAKNGYSLVRDRRNVILLGDHIGDLGMSDGVDYDNRITIGFLNENINSWLSTYTTAFDIVVLNDGAMTSVLDLIQELSR
ncbi:cytosolic 5'-nucleotidase 3 isoform X1 [Selaginella moellendorffii]|nr:cytosolic 5'-nucleotidase 3 isoform X1 [Selaginella moellendorffii]|eukprot:XP_002967154.2 cytosolic 5'-nucleotidase 3 isoform X1 [Selaginella moellendorffii]